MACVLTAVVIEDGRATVGHVGDTRAYKLRRGRIEKITRDHSPVGEREDANEISELEAMRHRVVLSPAAELEGTETDSVLGYLLEAVEVPR